MSVLFNPPEPCGNPATRRARELYFNGTNAMPAAPRKCGRCRCVPALWFLTTDEDPADYDTSRFEIDGRFRGGLLLKREHFRADCSWAFGGWRLGYDQPLNENLGDFGDDRWTISYAGEVPEQVYALTAASVPFRCLGENTFQHDVGFIDADETLPLTVKIVPYYGQAVDKAAES